MAFSSPSMHPLRRAVFVGAGFLLASLSVLADDWPQFRGPNRDGISRETGLLREWPAAGPALAWKIKGVGTGLSSVSVAGGRLYTMGEDSSSSYVFAFEEASGKKLWSAKVGPIGGGSGFPGPRCTPTVDGNLVVALGQFGDLVALEASSGKELWRTHLKNDLGGDMMSLWGYAESPLIDGDKILCTPGGKQGTVVALDRQTGKVLWRTSEWKDKAGYNSMVIATIHGVRQYVHFTGDDTGRMAPPPAKKSGDKNAPSPEAKKSGERKKREEPKSLAPGHVAGIDPATGKILWMIERTGKTAVAASPVVSGDMVFVSSGYNAGCHMFRVDKTDAGLKASQVYANKDISSHHGGVILVGSNVFGFSERSGWLWQDLKSGNIVQTWPIKEFGKGSVSCADGMLYLRLERDAGTIVLLDPSTDGIKVKGRFDQPDRSSKNSWPYLTIANGRLYVRDQDTILAYNIKK